MILNFFKTAWRNIKKGRAYSVITILGLSTGFSACFLIYLFIQHELSYDRFNIHANRIYRVVSEAENANGKSSLAVTPSPWAPAMQKDYPEIESFVRLLKDEKSTIGKPGEKQFNENKLLLADSTFFHVFSWKLLRGNLSSLLDAPNAVVLTREAAIRYFGTEDALGKPVTVRAFGRTIDGIVTAIAEAPETPSHFNFNVLLSMKVLGDISGMWSYHMFQSYLLLKPGVSAGNLQKKFAGFGERYINGNANADGKQDISLQPVTDIHLHSDRIGEIEPNGNILYVWVFSGIGAFLLIIACFNYMNLSTARSLTRAKEIGIRKVVGAEKRQIILQFLGETFLFAVISLIIALLITATALPAFNRLTESVPAIRINAVYSTWLFILSLVLFVAFLAGFYPALILSAYRPVEVLKGRFQKLSAGISLRKSLVTIQFVITIALITGTIIIQQQLHFLRNKEVGFDKSNVMIVTLPGSRDSANIETFKTGLLQDGNIHSVAASSSIPGSNIPVNLVNTGEADTKNAQPVQMLFADLDFIRTMKMHVVAGRDFSAEMPTDKQQGFLINESALHKFGFANAQSAVNHKFQWVFPGNIVKSGILVGVVQDFNITPLRNEVQALAIHYTPARFQYLFIRFNQNAFEHVRERVQKQFSALFPRESLEFTMLNETMNRMYLSEQKLAFVFTCFSFLAILIACIGILGLSLNSIQQRVKEIGIRKVLGGSIGSISGELIKEFVFPVVIAAFIATPLSWVLMHSWLQRFAYKISISVWLFIVTTICVLLISVLTLAFQSIRAAMVSPVKNLRMD